jgi:LAO/AO transport system kinase
VSATRPQEVPAEVQPLLAAFREGKQNALGRAITLVENEGPGFQELLHAVLGAGPTARRVGVTGPPGGGKSTLLAALAATYRASGERVGVVAVDPTSPFSGGALLGDRIRMNDLATDPGIFIRSMATRGSLGGLATTTREVLDLMDAFGFERVLVETVGVGQTELEITGAADTVVVVLVPESGDAIQAMKAGLMEIADVFVVNKADRPGADRLIKEIRTALHLRTGEARRDVPAHHDAWEIPVLRAVAQTGEGVGDVIDAVAAHRVWLEASGALERRRHARAERRVRDVVERALRRRAWTDPSVQATLARGLDGVARGDETPYSVASAIVGQVLGEGRDA